MILIYHNPRCSKSRAALEFVQRFANDNGILLTVVEYLKTPLNLSELKALQQQLGEQSHHMVRDNDGLSPEEQCNILVEQPELLQRPIVSYRGNAAIGRPIENIYALLGVGH